VEELKDPSEAKALAEFIPLYAPLEGPFFPGEA